MIFYVNKKEQITDEHKIHSADCPHLPDSSDRIFLGDFATCEEALNAAKKLYSKVNGCYYCCKSCNIDENMDSFIYTI